MRRRLRAAAAAAAGCSPPFLLILLLLLLLLLSIFTRDPHIWDTNTIHHGKTLLSSDVCPTGIWRILIFGGRESCDAVASSEELAAAATGFLPLF